MLMPNIGKKIENEKVVMLLENEMTQIKNKFLEKIVLDEKLKNQMEKMNWEKTICKYEKIDEKISKNIKKNINVIVYGSQEYIDKMNKTIEKWISKNKGEFENINIINAYEAMELNNNLDFILEKHDKILNTSGEKNIEDIFQGYRKNYLNID